MKAKINTVNTKLFEQTNCKHRPRKLTNNNRQDGQDSLQAICQEGCPHQEGKPSLLPVDPNAVVTVSTALVVVVCRCGDDSSHLISMRRDSKQSAVSNTFLTTTSLVLAPPTPRNSYTLTGCDWWQEEQEARRVLFHVHLQGVEAGPPRHGYLQEGYVDYELVHQRHL